MLMGARKAWCHRIQSGWLRFGLRYFFDDLYDWHNRFPLPAEFPPVSAKKPVEKRKGTDA